MSNSTINVRIVDRGPQGAFPASPANTVVGNPTGSTAIPTSISMASLPISTATQTALNGKQNASANLSRLDGTVEQQRTAIGAAGTAVANSFAQTQTFTGKIAVSETTGSDVGVIQIGNMRVHTFFPVGGDSAFGSNLFIGKNAGNFTLSTSVGVPEQGIANFGIGENVLSSLTTGYRNMAFGPNVLRDTTTGYHNTGMGGGALALNTTGQYNSAFGIGTLLENTTGANNTGIGGDALYWNKTGSRNNALGRNALFFNSTGNDNSAFGHESLYDNLSGNLNSAFGAASLGDCVSGDRNSAIGVAALRALSTGDSNTGLGDNAGATITTGNNNTCVGLNSGSGLTTGSNNVVIGGALMNPTDAGHVVIADGLGNRRLSFDASGVGTFPGQVYFETVCRFYAPLRDQAGANRIRFLAGSDTELSSGGLNLTGLDINGSGIYTMSAARAYFNGTMVCRLESSETLSGNREMVFEAVSNTQVRLKYRGLDGQTRTTTFTLS